MEREQIEKETSVQPNADEVSAKGEVSLRLSVACSAKAGNGREDELRKTLRERVLAEVLSALGDEGFVGLMDEAVAAATVSAKEKVLVRMREAVGMAITQAVLGTDRGYEGSFARCVACGGRGRFVRHEPKSYLMLTGEAEIERSVYECRCGHRWRPLDERWDLPKGRLSPGVERVVALMGGLVPFATAQKVLWETARVNVSATTIRTTTEAIGAEMEAEIAAGVEAGKRGDIEGRPKPDVMIVGVDGAMLNTREEGWKETKVGRVLRCRHDGNKELILENSSYVAQLGTIDVFRPKLDVEVQRQGGQGREVTLMLGDGAAWIWEMTSEILPEAVQVLDYYHLKEHVYGAAKILFGEGTPEGKEWAENVSEEHLRREKIDAAVTIIQATGGTSEAHEQARVALLRYIETHRGRMPYAKMEAKGYPIGSGCVESACKQIVVKRHKQSGMRWSQVGVQQMLTIAAYCHSDRWDEFWARRKAA